VGPAAERHITRIATKYDYADLKVPMFSRMFQRRCRGIGYKIQLTGSAVRGCPADMPLPIDPGRKSQHRALLADSLKRP